MQQLELPLPEGYAAPLDAHTRRLLALQRMDERKARKRALDNNSTPRPKPRE